MTLTLVSRVGGLIVIVALIAAFLLFTDQGASVIAGARCAPTWLRADRAAYQTCYDVEREQIVEDRARRHTLFDE
jgi:hypothetical protein